jgi:hypothetical protein
MSDLTLLLVNLVVTVLAGLTGMIFIAFLTGSCAMFMLVVVAGAYRHAAARRRSASPG